MSEKIEEVPFNKSGMPESEIWDRLRKAQKDLDDLKKEIKENKEREKCLKKQNEKRQN